VFDPTGSVVSARVATPLAFSGELPSFEEPFQSVTVPVGVGAPVMLAFTVVVKVTEPP
jgi:hypothetical protein